MMRGRGVRLLVAGTALALLGGGLASTVPASAGTSGRWTKISSQSVDPNSEPGILKLDNGNLLVTYTREAADGTQGIGWTTVRFGGITDDTGSIISGWETVSSDPQPVSISNSQVTTVFSGLRTLDPADAYSEGSMYSASGPPDGSSWALDSTGLSQNQSAYASTSAAAQYSWYAGPLMVAYAVDDTIYWREGFSPSIPADTPDNTITTGGCCLTDVELARESIGGEIYAAWFSNNDHNPGRWVQSLWPTVQPPQKAPRSSSGGEAIGTDRSGAFTSNREHLGLYLAYCQGPATCNRVALWEVGEPGTVAVPRSSGADVVATTPAYNRRLWVIYSKPSTGMIYAARTNRGRTYFGPPQAIRLPNDSPGVFSIKAMDGGVHFLSLVINNGAGLYHTEVFPRLALDATPRRFDGDRRTTVTFKVTDVGKPVDDAVVTVAGESARTDGQGKAEITFRAGTRPRTYTARATAFRYSRGLIGITVTR
jgi:hypothetical protein